MDQQEFIASVAELMKALQSPMKRAASANPALMDARHPWQRLHDAAGIGWLTGEQYEKEFTKIMELSID